MKKRITRTVELQAGNIRSKGRVGGWRKYISLFEIGMIDLDHENDDLVMDIKMAIVHRAQDWNGRMR